MPDPIRILLVDDHPLMLMGIRSMLEGKSGIEVVGTAPEGEQALKKAAGYIRHELGLRVDLRYTPELLFERDRNIAYGAHIAQVLKDVIPQEAESQGEENGDGKTE